NGSVWTSVTTPDEGGGSSTFNQLNSMSAVSTNDVWAVGIGNVTASVRTSLTMHWNGTLWSTVASPNPGVAGTELWGVETIASNDVWAVGYSQPASGSAQT